MYPHDYYSPPSPCSLYIWLDPLETSSVKQWISSYISEKKAAAVHTAKSYNIETKCMNKDTK